MATQMKAKMKDKREIKTENELITNEKTKKEVATPVRTEGKAKLEAELERQQDLKGKVKKESTSSLLKMTLLALLVAVGVVISPLLRVEGMCPMAHLINIVCAVLLGPWYALGCALMIGLIRMFFMGIPPLALTGAIFGATLSGVGYRLTKGKIMGAVVGEVIGTGLIGAIVSYPVMTLFWGRSDLTWFFYVPSFIGGTLIGGSIAFLFLVALKKTGQLVKFQRSLGAKVYDTSNIHTGHHPSKVL